MSEERKLCPLKFAQAAPEVLSKVLQKPGVRLGEGPAFRVCDRDDCAWYTGTHCAILTLSKPVS